jgi:nucleotide-binding universal stress UspA family protein/quercetin dioxygenase-like cupin family protein
MRESIQTILHPSDFSENARFAFQTACSLAAQYHARLIVLHVESPLMRDPPWDPMELAEAQDPQGKTFAWPQPADPQVRIEHRVAEGDAAAEIVRLARVFHCDLIVIGTHGRTGLARLLAGSVAEEVLRNAPCQVLAVKNPLPGAPVPVTEPTTKPGEIVNVHPLAPELASDASTTLLRTGHVQVIRLLVPRGKEIPPHQTKALTLVHCLQGLVSFSAFGKIQDLQAGQMLYLPAGETHALKGIKDAALLLTICR